MDEEPMVQDWASEFARLADTRRINQDCKRDCAVCIICHQGLGPEIQLLLDQYSLRLSKKEREEKDSEARNIMLFIIMRVMEYCSRDNEERQGNGHEK